MVLFAADAARTIAFYRALGVPLADEDHGDGVVHAAADVGGVHVAVFQGDAAGEQLGWRRQGSTFAGFYVASLELTVVALEALGAKVLQLHQHRDWGCRVVVEDPDGRAVEINQRDHCAGD